MKDHINKFNQKLWLFILGFVVSTSYDAYTSVPNTELNNNLTTNNFINKSSITQKYFFNQSVNYKNNFGFNVVNNTNSITPLNSPSGNVSKFSSGFNHTCAIHSNGKLFCWGNNSYGQLGDNSTEIKNIPTPVISTELFDSSSVKLVSAGCEHTCAITIDNKLFCWGKNDYGQLGNGTDGYGTYNNIPTPVISTELFDSSSVKLVSAGCEHTCAITTDNKLFCWGSNGSGQLSDGTYDLSKNTPTPVISNELFNSNSVKLVSTGHSYTCAITTDNKLFCWGYNSHGQLGNGNAASMNDPLTPVISNELFDSNSLESISASNLHTCAITIGNMLFCWGGNFYGQLGDGTDGYSTYKNTPTPVISNEFFDSTSVKSVSVGYEHTCAITTDNKLFCWGYNSNGQLGDGTNDNKKTTPNPVIANELFDNTSVKSVGAGGYHTCAITTDNKLFCWGDNSNGQLGDGTNINKNIPTLISLIDDEICNGIDDDLDGETDEGFTIISGTCYANSDIENIDECNPTDIVINNRCYNPEDYNKKNNEITTNHKPLPPIVKQSSNPNNINVTLEKQDLGKKLQNNLQKKAAKKYKIKKVKLRRRYVIRITKISDNDNQSINALGSKKKSKQKVIMKTVKKNNAVIKGLKPGTYKIEYKVIVQATINKKSVVVWGNQKSNKFSTPVKIRIVKK